MPGPCSGQECRDYSEALIRMSRSNVQRLTDQLYQERITLQDWHIQMRQELRQAYSFQLIAASGGDKANVQNSDWLRLGTRLRSQYGYLEDFAHAIRDGKLSVAQAVARAEMYSNSAKVAFWEKDVPVRLPRYPRDGSTQCLTNCTCSVDWEYERDEDGRITAVKAYWRLGATENHCIDCPTLAAEWSPLRIPVSSGGANADIEFAEHRADCGCGHDHKLEFAKAG
jgi:hypothetical protein